MINLIKGGLRQQVSEADFERLYKPKGWVVDEAFAEVHDEKQVTIKKLQDETKIKNYVKMTQSAQKQFNDNLFKSENK